MSLEHILEEKNKIIQMQKSEIARLRSMIVDVCRIHDSIQEKHAEISAKFEKCKEEKKRLFELWESERNECIEVNTKLTEKEADLDEVAEELEKAISYIKEKEDEVEGLKRKVKVLARKNKILRDSQKNEKVLQPMQNLLAESQFSEIGKMVVGLADIEIKKIEKENSRIENAFKSESADWKAKYNMLEAEFESLKTQCIPKTKESANLCSLPNTAICSTIPKTESPDLPQRKLVSCKSTIAKIPLTIQRQTSANDLVKASNKRIKLAKRNICKGTATKVSVLPIKDLSPKFKAFQCKMCPKTFAGLGPLKHHMTSTHEMPGFLKRFIFGCKYCGEMFEMRGQLRQHACRKVNAIISCNTLEDSTEGVGCNLETIMETPRSSFVNENPRDVTSAAYTRAGTVYKKIEIIDLTS